MSKYTTQVRFICETEAGVEESKGFNDLDSILSDTTIGKVFNFQFPIFDEDYRIPLEKKILMHFYTREIGFESVGLWKLKLRAKMNEIMPLYNQYYESALIEFNPMDDVSFEKRGQTIDVGTGNTNGTSKDTVDGEKINKFSDTPQGGIQGIEDDEYLTNATVNTDDTETDRVYQNNMSNRNQGDYFETIRGKMGLKSNSSLLKEFRQTFLNIDMMVIAELEELFMGLW